jgi:hypothetical protein
VTPTSRDLNNFQLRQAKFPSYLNSSYEIHSFFSMKLSWLLVKRPPRLENKGPTSTNPNKTLVKAPSACTPLMHLRFINGGPLYFPGQRKYLATLRSQIHLVGQCNFATDFFKLVQPMAFGKKVQIMTN